MSTITPIKRKRATSPSKVKINGTSIKNIQPITIANLQKIYPSAVAEFKFSKDRKFRADFAIQEYMILIEYEGIRSKKSRHTSITGYSKDCEKYNLATTLGYSVLRYTALNYKNVWDDLAKMILPF